MKYLLTHAQAATSEDLVADIPPEATVGDLIQALLDRPSQPTPTPLDRRGPQPDDRADSRPRNAIGSLAVVLLRPDGEIELAPELAALPSSLRSGDRLTLRPQSRRVPPWRQTRAAALTSATLHVESGREQGASFTLLPGSNSIGRDSAADLTLTDPQVSRQHARVTVGETITITDTNSANGVLLDGIPIDHAQLRHRQCVTIGSSSLRLSIPNLSIQAKIASGETHSDRDRFMRSPILTPTFTPESHPAPELPRKPTKPRLPAAMLAAPVVMALMLYALTGRLASLIFVLLMPLMLIGSWIENRRSVARQSTEAWQTFERDLNRLGEIVGSRQTRERQVRLAEHPSAAGMLRALEVRGALLWSRRADRPGFGTVRLGTGPQPSRVSVESNGTGTAEPRAWNDLRNRTQAWGTLANAPVAVELSAIHSLGVAGPTRDRNAIIAGLLLQLVTLHSPNELRVAALLGPKSTGAWDWLKWLPHTRAQRPPLRVAQLATDLNSGSALLSALMALLDDRRSAGAEHHFPSIVVLVAADCPLSAGDVVTVMESARGLDVHFLWSAAEQKSLPAGVGAFLAVDDAGKARFGNLIDGAAVFPLEVERVAEDQAVLAARQLTPLEEVGGDAATSADLPAKAPYLAVVGTQMAQDSDAVMERWRETGSLPGTSSSIRSPSRLRALVGQSASGPLVVDLINQGPHALVAGTTGSGKSELLQTWVAALANDYSPARVNFLLVDYKGGAAFAECAQLPHTVGLVTDLTPSLVQRALTSLNAELTRREHFLDFAGVKDLGQLEEAGHPDTPARLVVVIDEFAALTQEVPKFVDGVVNIAQRGRSLGIHLILATQRPAGVIKDNVKSNTNLRICLRMADRADSVDVLGTDTAAGFDPQTPGRAAMRTGPGPLTPFQSCYVGGHSGEQHAASRVTIAPLTLPTKRQFAANMSSRPQGPEPTHSAHDATDLQRLVACISRANESQGLPRPRRPWLSELSATIALDELVESAESGVPIGRADRPHEQDQPIANFDPDRDGHLVVFGTSGSGKSTTLRTLAVSMVQSDPGPVHVYGFEAGSGGLTALTTLPQTGTIVDVADGERTIRLLRHLERLVHDRSGSFSSAGANNLSEYRSARPRESVPRVLLLIDGLAAFRSAHEADPTSNALERLQVLAGQGRSVGIHLAITADRPGAVPAGLAAVIPQRLTLRIANDADAALLNLPKDAFDSPTPPGRGFLAGLQVQIASVEGSAPEGSPASAVGKVAGRSLAPLDLPTSIPVLADDIALSELPRTVCGEPTIGIEFEDLTPVGFSPKGPFLITGPPGSGRTTATATLLRSALRYQPQARTALLTDGASPLLSATEWTECAAGESEVARLARTLSERVSGSTAERWMIVLQDPGSFLNGSADLPLQGLTRTLRGEAHLLLVDGDTQSMTGSWPLLVAIRSQRCGLALQPDQSDGELIFRTPSPRLRSTRFPRGRGLLIGQGRSRRIQVARDRSWQDASGRQTMGA